MLAALFFTLAVATGESHRFEHLGMTVRADGTRLEVTAVEPNGAAGRAGLRTGNRIVRVRDVPVETIEQLVWLLRPRDGAHAVDIVVEGEIAGAPPVSSTRPTGFRASFLAVGNEYTTTDRVRSAWLGALLGYAAVPGLWALVGAGYYAVGPDPGFGKHGLAPVAGAEYEHALPVEGISVFARGLLGVTISFGPGSAGAPGRVSPIAAFVQLGVRVFVLDVAFAASWGPAEGMNLGAAGGFGFVL